MLFHPQPGFRRIVSPGSQICKRVNCLIIIVTEGGIVASKGVLLKGVGMTRGSIKELAEALRERHLRGNKEEKGRIGANQPAKGRHSATLERLCALADRPTQA